MGRASREKKKRKDQDQRHGWVVELVTPKAGWPAGGRWFDTDQTRVRPPNLVRFLCHIAHDPHVRVAAVRPKTIWS